MTSRYRLASLTPRPLSPSRCFLALNQEGIVIPGNPEQVNGEKASGSAGFLDETKRVWRYEHDWCRVGRCRPGNTRSPTYSSVVA